VIAQLEEAVADRIREKLSAAASKIAVQRGTDLMPSPGIAVSIEDGKFAKNASDNYRLEVTGYVDIVFKELSSDAERRKGIYLVLEGIYLALILQTLGLKITPIVPRDFKNVTSKEDRDEGKIVFTFSFTTSWIVSKPDEEDAADLLTIGLGYYLNPASETATATDTVTLHEEEL
jgi:hypothetical protein